MSEKIVIDCVNWKKTAGRSLLWIFRRFPFYALCLMCLSLRQAEDKFRAHTFGADHIDGFFVSLDDFLYDGESESGALLVLAAGRVRLEEAVPDLFLILLRDADAGILDRDKDLIMLFVDVDSDCGIVMRKLDRVVHQVVDHLLNLGAVSIDECIYLRESQAEVNIPAGAGSLEGCTGILDDLVDIEADSFQMHGFALQRVQA